MCMVPFIDLRLNIFMILELALLIFLNPGYISLIANVGDCNHVDNNLHTLNL